VCLIDSGYDAYMIRSGACNVVIQYSYFQAQQREAGVITVTKEALSLAVVINREQLQASDSALCMCHTIDNSHCHCKRNLSNECQECSG
jgi:hypothetical protein